jgi:hypothetical protein
MNRATSGGCWSSTSAVKYPAIAWPQLAQLTAHPQPPTPPPRSAAARPGHQPVMQHRPCDQRVRQRGRPELRQREPEVI